MSTACWCVRTVAVSDALCARAVCASVILFVCIRSLLAMYLIVNELSVFLFVCTCATVRVHICAHAGARVWVCDTYTACTHASTIVCLMCHSARAHTHIHTHIQQYTRTHARARALSLSLPLSLTHAQGVAYGTNAKLSSWDEVASLAPLVFQVCYFFFLVVAQLGQSRQPCPRCFASVYFANLLLNYYEQHIIAFVTVIMSLLFSKFVLCLNPKT